MKDHPLEPIDEKAIQQVHLPHNAVLELIVACFKALGDSTRAKILYALLDQSLCVRDLAIIVGISESGISHQLSELKDKHLVKSERKGNVMYYSIAYEHVHNLLKEADYYADHIKSNIPDHPKNK